MVIGMIKRFAIIAPVGSNSEVSVDSGVRAGLAADSLGMLRAAPMVSIVVREKTDKSSSVLTTESLILNLYTQTAIVASLMSLMLQARLLMKTQTVSLTPAISKSSTSAQAMEFGPVVAQMSVMVLVV